MQEGCICRKVFKDTIYITKWARESRLRHYFSQRSDPAWFVNNQKPELKYHPLNIFPSERASGVHESKTVKDLQTWKEIIWELKVKKQWINFKNFGVFPIKQMKQMDCSSLLLSMVLLSGGGNLNCKIPKSIVDNYLPQVLIYWGGSASINTVGWKGPTKYPLLWKNLVLRIGDITKSISKIKPILFTGVHFLCHHM